MFPREHLNVLVIIVTLKMIFLGEDPQSASLKKSFAWVLSFPELCLPVDDPVDDPVDELSRFDTILDFLKKNIQDFNPLDILLPKSTCHKKEIVLAF